MIFPVFLSILGQMEDARFEEGCRLFNALEFFDAHEVWEDLWQEYRGDDRTFLQALIQIAAGCYHAQCGNEKGARSQLSKGIRKLRTYLPHHGTVRSAALVTEVERWLGQASGSALAMASAAYPRIHRIR